MNQSGAELDSALKAQRPSTLILDVRHNNGENSYVGDLLHRDQELAEVGLSILR